MTERVQGSKVQSSRVESFEDLYVYEQARKLTNSIYCLRISGMLSNLITYLKGSRYRGTKYKKPLVKSMAEEINELLQELQREKDAQ